MYFDKIKNKGQARIFENDLLESLSKTHPLVIYSIYFPIIVFMLYYGASYKEIHPWKEFTLFCLGVLVWSLFEYMMHRYVFHWVAKSPRAKRFVYMMHGVHHEFPRDKERLLMPPIPSLLVACLLSISFYFLIGWFTLAFFPGFVFGYILYGSMHYAIHAFSPPHFLKTLWRNHYLHHYKEEDKGFGVSSVLWDLLFGSVPKNEKRYLEHL
ncbi:MAG: sterol desaturase family protein [Bacteroidetes bacterium]|nr:sterol desaturase family protein [Bacteroidota bacterium]